MPVGAERVAPSAKTSMNEPSAPSYLRMLFTPKLLTNRSSSWKTMSRGLINLPSSSTKLSINSPVIPSYRFILSSKFTTYRSSIPSELPSGPKVKPVGNPISSSKSIAKLVAGSESIGFVAISLTLVIVGVPVKSKSSKIPKGSVMTLIILFSDEFAKKI